MFTFTPTQVVLKKLTSFSTQIHNKISSVTHVDVVQTRLYLNASLAIQSLESKEKDLEIYSLQKEQPV
jgi:hypothetical protein